MMTVYPCTLALVDLPVMPEQVASFTPSTDRILDAFGGGWSAELNVTVRKSNGRSVTAELSHRGPLRIQKALWPEGPQIAHLIVLHPPSGLAAGDRLSLNCRVEDGAGALLTTPGAGRWYRADVDASQSVRLVNEGTATLEWLPQETILHDGVRGEQSIEWDFARLSRGIGWDIAVLGRRGSGEAFRDAEFRSRIQLRREGRLLFDEASRLHGGENVSAALGSSHVSGVLWAIGAEPFAPDTAEAVSRRIDECTGIERVDDARIADGAIGAATLLDAHLLLVRMVGGSPSRVREALTAVWSMLRPGLIGCAPQLPRIWAT